MKRNFEVLSQHLCGGNEETEENAPASRFKFQTSYIQGRFETHLTPRFVGVLDFLHT